MKKMTTKKRLEQWGMIHSLENEYKRLSNQIHDLELEQREVCYTIQLYLNEILKHKKTK